MSVMSRRHHVAKLLWLLRHEDIRVGTSTSTQYKYKYIKNVQVQFQVQVQGFAKCMCNWVQLPSTNV